MLARACIHSATVPIHPSDQHPHSPGQLYAVPMNATPSDGLAQYSHGHQASVLTSHAARTAENSCAYFLDRLQPGLRILDVGCGPGSITLDLSARVGGNVVGIDFSVDAIAAAQSAATQRDDHAVQFLVGDIMDLDIEPDSFDIVHAHQVLQHLPDPVGALCAMAHYCADDGIIAVRDADYGAMAWYPQLPGLDRWRDTYTRTARKGGGEPDAGRRLRAWAHAAGLRIEQASSSLWTYATPETTAWWGASQADRVLTSSFAERAAADGLDPADLAQIAEDWRAWGEDPDAWFFLPHGEVIARPASDTRQAQSP